MKSAATNAKAALRTGRGESARVGGCAASASWSSDPAGAAAAASAGYLAAGVSAALIYRARAPFRLLELVVPQSGDFAVLRTLAPVPRASLARRGAP